MRRVDWNALDAGARAAVLARPTQAREAQVRAAVTNTIAQVRADGDAALLALTRRFDRCELQHLHVTTAEFERAERALDAPLKAAIIDAHARIEAFHRAGLVADVRIETAPGVICERVQRPIERVGLYVPAGTAPLPSTALMLGVPARLAGCTGIVLCTPPRIDGHCDEAVLFAARLCGIQTVFKLGGAQAIAAMAFGTESVPCCDKLFGPGSVWVTEAKQQVAATVGGPAIDMPAGPSEVLVIADAGAEPEFVAADLLAQAEHGVDSQVVLVSDSAALIDKVAAALTRQCAKLARADIAAAALESGALIEVASLAQALEVSNRYAPEHLIIQTAQPRDLLAGVRHAGSVFLGPWSPESIGDYCSGTNHVLPTGGAARALGGLAVSSFQKGMTVQTLSAAGLGLIGPCARTLALAEQLDGHAAAVSVRLRALGEAA